LGRFEIDAAEIPDSWERLMKEREQMIDLEKQLIELALRRHNGVVAYAAKDLGLRRSSLASRMKTLGIEAPASPLARSGDK